MKNTSNVISANSEELLRAITGALIEKISLSRAALTEISTNADEYPKILTTSAIKHLSSQVAILHLMDADISFWSSETTNRDDEYPDLAQVEVVKDSGECFKSQQQYYVSFQCNSIIQQIEIVNEHVTITESNSSSFILTNTKAIIIHLSGGKLILEKDCVWSEFWYISLLNAEDEYTFYNQWDEKADDDKTTYQVTLERYFI